MPDGTKSSSSLNGIDVTALAEVASAVAEDPAKGKIAFKVATAWKGQTRSETTIESCEIGGERVDRRFKLTVDEPLELLGENTSPNPQEYLLTALNACIMVGYVAGAAVKGIRLDHVEIETEAEIDLRGFFGIDPTVKPGCESVRYTVRMKGDGTPDQFREIHETVMRTSPNYFNVSQPVRIDSKLVVEK